MKEEIVGGLRNAVERGYSLERAVRSFIAAGYSPDEVYDASKEISGISITNQIISPILQTNQISQAPLQNVPTSPPVKLNVQPKIIRSIRDPQQTNPKRTLEIVFLIILLILIGVLVVALIYFDKVIDFVKGL